MKNFTQFLESISLVVSIRIDGKDRSTIDSLGHLLDTTREGIEKFWKWFGDSKIIDDYGRPLVVYHGTDQEFQDFDINEGGGVIYFSSQTSISGGYGKTLKKAYISMKNPYVFNWSTYKDENGVNWYFGENNERISERPEGFPENERTGNEIDITYSGEVKDDLIKRGFDGAISDEGWGGFDEVAVFYPEQIWTIS